MVLSEIILLANNVWAVSNLQRILHFCPISYLVPLLNLAQGGLGGWVDDGKRFATGGVDPLIIDEDLQTQALRRTMYGTCAVFTAYIMNSGMF